ncbi:MAG TPA: hypothetical protein VIM00_01285, partial [Candidatus Acidoferrum sp.]
LERIINKAIEKDCSLRYQSAADMHSDLRRLRRDTDSGRLSGSGKAAAQEAVAAAESAAQASREKSAEAPAGHSKLWMGLAAALLAILGVGYAAYHFGAGSHAPAGPTKISQISHWDKPMDRARLSPDGHAVAFSSPVNGIKQVFLMLATGGEALQLTSDEGDKFVTNFSADGTEIYYRRVFGKDETWAVPTLGGNSKRVLAGYAVVPSIDGNSLFFTKGRSRSVYRSDRSGMGEETLATLEANSSPILRILPFPDGKRLLLVTGSTVSNLESAQIYFVDLEKKSAEPFTSILAEPDEVTWQEPGKSLLFGRTISGLTNVWKMNLADKALSQVTSGPGPDHSPMPDPAGKGLYLVNGKSTGFLTNYNTRTKQSTDIAAENATQPVLSHSGKRLMYITIPSRDRNELWVADVDGNNKTRLTQASSAATGIWSPDDSRVSFFTEEPGTEPKLYLANADGTGLQSLKWMSATIPQGIVWSADQKSVYINGIEKGARSSSVWREAADGSEPEKLADTCGFVFDASADGKYLLSLIPGGDRIGIYSFSLADHACTPVVPGVVTFGINIEKNGQSFLYALPGKKDVTIYRQKWSAGKAVGTPQVAMKLPLVFPLIAGGNAYDFSRDLATVAYARSGGHADLYLITQ